MLPYYLGNIKILTSRVIRHAKKRNRKLWVWLYEGDVVRTVNSKEDLDKMKELGATGIFTDFPSRMIGVF